MIGKRVEFKDIDNEKHYQCFILCHECGAELNSSKVETGKYISHHWTEIVFSSGLVTKACPDGCRSTHEDLNINTDLVVCEMDDEE